LVEGKPLPFLHAFGRDLENWLQAESKLLHPVHVDVAESDEGLTVRAEVPASFRAENLMVGVEARRLTIAGEREADRSAETKRRFTGSRVPTTFSA